MKNQNAATDRISAYLNNALPSKEGIFQFPREKRLAFERFHFPTLPPAYGGKQADLPEILCGRLATGCPQLFPDPLALFPRRLPQSCRSGLPWPVGKAP